MDKVTPVAAGDAVSIVDENYVAHTALVVHVHGIFPAEGEAGYVPSINVVYVSADKAKSDSYGHQIERLSSLQHLSQGPSTMPTPGRYWVNL